MLRAFCLIAFCTILSCATIETSPVYASRINGIDAPLLSLQHIVSGFLPVGVRTVSPNGREFLSKYFVIGEKEYKPADDALDRYYVQIIVLGDRRPYDIEISATREKRVLRGEDFTYVVTGHDRRLAKELVTQLREQLTKRREDRNIIDDFRVF